MTSFDLQIISGFVMNVTGLIVLIGFTETLGNALFRFDELPPELIALYNSTMGQDMPGMMSGM